MISANIYSMETLSAQTREAVHDGIGMVAAYMGEQVVARELRIKLPTNAHGNVNPARVGHTKLDTLVELHLMAVPLEPVNIPLTGGGGKRVGVAELGGGWAYVDTSHDASSLIRTTTAHEAGHAFGFLIPGTPQEDPTSPYHCCDSDCVMHKRAVITVAPGHTLDLLTNTDRAGGKAWGRRFLDVLTGENVAYSLEKQYDFCLPCKVDMRDKGNEHIEKLRYDRVFVRKSV